MGSGNERTVMPDTRTQKNDVFGRASPDTTQPRSCAGGADLWVIREDLAHIVQQLDAMMANKSGSKAEAEVEAAATVMHNRASAGNMPYWRNMARAALEAAAKVRDGK